MKRRTSSGKLALAQAALLSGGLLAIPSLASAQEEQRHEVHRVVRKQNGRVVERRTVRRERVPVSGRETERVDIDRRGPAHRTHHYRRYVVRREGDLELYRRPYTRYRSYRTYGVYYGLPPSLVVHRNLNFLSDGLLTASYVNDEGRTVYVYLLDEDGVRREYFVRDDGAILESRILR